MRSRPVAFALGLLVAVLAGCATQPSERKLPESNADIDAFALSGRIAVRIEHRGYTASLRWTHRSDGSDKLRLLSPVGSVLGEIEADASGATLTTGDKKVYQSADPQSLTREVLGWDLPLAGLRYWVTGRADPRAPVQSEDRDDRQRLKSLRQSDWRIDYLDHFGDAGLPSRLNLAYGELNLRLVVEHWDLSQ